MSPVCGIFLRGPKQYDKYSLFVDKGGGAVPQMWIKNGRGGGEGEAIRGGL